MLIVYYKYLSESLRKEVVSMAIVPPTKSKEEFLEILFKGERTGATEISYEEYTTAMELKKNIALYGRKGSEKYKRKQIEVLLKEVYSSPNTTMELRKNIYEHIMFDMHNISEYYDSIKDDQNITLKELY